MAVFKKETTLALTARLKALHGGNSSVLVTRAWTHAGQKRGEEERKPKS